MRNAVRCLYEACKYNANLDYTSLLLTAHDDSLLYLNQNIFKIYIMAMNNQVNISSLVFSSKFYFCAFEHCWEYLIIKDKG